MVNGFHSRRIVIKTRIAKPFPFFRLAKDQDQEQGQASSFFSKGTCLHLVVGVQPVLNEWDLYFSLRNDTEFLYLLYR